MRAAVQVLSAPPEAHPAARILRGEAVAAAAADWAALVARRPGATPFAGPLLQLANRAAFAPAEPALAIAVPGEGGLTAFLPMAQDRLRVGPGLVLRELGFFRGAHVLRNHALLPEHGAGEAAAVLDAALRLGGWDTLHFQNMADDLAPFQAAAAAAGLMADAPTPGRRLMFADLTGGFDAYLATRSGQFRRQIRKRRREMAQAGRLDIRRLTGRAAILAILPDWMRLAGRAWQGHAAEAPARGAERAFHAALADCGDLWWLTCDDRPLAALRMLAGPGALYVHMMHYDPAARERAPGLVLFEAMMADAGARGIARVDFNGASPFFARWATGDIPHRSIRFYAPTLRGRAARMARACLRRDAAPMAVEETP